jgi:hypothetical protein
VGNGALRLKEPKSIARTHRANSHVQKSSFLRHFPPSILVVMLVMLVILVLVVLVVLVEWCLVTSCCGAAGGGGVAMLGSWTKILLELSEVS